MKCTKKNEQLARRIIGVMLAVIASAGYVALLWVAPIFTAIITANLMLACFIAIAITWLCGEISFCDDEE
jgi:hypothetical protein